MPFLNWLSMKADAIRSYPLERLQDNQNTPTTPVTPRHYQTSLHPTTLQKWAGFYKYYTRCSTFKFQLMPRIVESVSRGFCPDLSPINPPTISIVIASASPGFVSNPRLLDGPVTNPA
jgi:hypothetical protein